jgi:hypothetical protein
MAYKIHEFPKELGGKVSESVRDETDRRFDCMNRTILENIFDSIVKSYYLVQSIAKDEEFQDVMRDLGQKVEPTLRKFSGQKYIHSSATVPTLQRSNDQTYVQPSAMELTPLEIHEKSYVSSSTREIKPIYRTTGYSCNAMRWLVVGIVLVVAVTVVPQ